MRGALTMDKRGKVLVHGDEDALLLGGPAQHYRIAWVAATIARLGHVMAKRAEKVRDGAGDTGIDKESHAGSTRTASRLSSAMTALA